LKSGRWRLRFEVGRAYADQPPRVGSGKPQKDHTMRLDFAAVGLLLALVVGSCVPTGPITDLAVQATADPIEVSQGEAVELTAHGSAGTPPYIFRWSQQGEPDGADDVLPELQVTSRIITTAPLEALGDYVFRVMVTDSQGFSVYDWLTIAVVEPDPADIFEVAIDGPSTLTAEQAETYAALRTYEGNVEFEWAINTQEAEFSTQVAESTALTVSQAGTYNVTLTMRDLDTDETTSAQLAVEVSAAVALVVEITGEDTTVADRPIELTANVTDGSEDLSFAWRVVSGPGEFADDDQPVATFTSATAGEAVVEVEVVDNETEDRITAQVTITVEQGEPVEAFTVETDPPALVARNESIGISAVVSTDPGTLTYAWSAESGSPIIDDPTSSSPTVTITGEATTHLIVEVTATNESGSTRTESADVYLVTLEEAEPVVVFEIEDFGVVRIRLTPELTPITVANFLSYVDEGFYDGLIIHRVEVGAFGVIQGGGYAPDAVPDFAETVETHDPIINEAEFGGSNIRGTISMARTGEPDSATSQFFLNTTDNTSLDFAEGGNPGYAVFGEVIEGMDVLDRISEEVETTAQGQIHFVTEPVIMTSVTRE
jgi:cyclophilin family peptidyl-prolyl cis-trans isomerase